MANESVPASEAGVLHVAVECANPPEMNSEEAAVWNRLSPKVKQRLEELDSRIRPYHSALSMWDERLTPSQRARCGGDLESAWRKRGTLGIWMLAQGLTNRFMAVAVLGLQLAFLTEPTHAWLLQETGGKIRAKTDKSRRPAWNPDTGVLSLLGKPIRGKLRLLHRPSGMQQVLDAFRRPAGRGRSTIR